MLGENVGIYFLDAFDVSIQNTLGINTNSLESELLLYPNPVKDKLCLKSFKNILSVKIYDVLGHVILDQKSTPCLVVSTLYKVVYFLQVEFEDGKILIKKIIKK